MIQILSSFFISRISGTCNASRNQELEKVLRKNLQHPQVAQVNIFVDDQEAYDRALELATEMGAQDKLAIVAIGMNPLRFSDLFEHAATFPGQICMIINADNYLKVFDRSLLRHLQEDDRLTMVLSRHEADLTCPMVDRFSWAHDAYVFTAPILQNVIHNSRHPVTTSGGENVVIWELQRSYCVMNPAKQVVIVHEHESDVRIPRRVRLNWIRKGRCVPRVIPTDVLEGQNLALWHRRMELEEVGSRPANDRRRKGLLEFIREWERP